MRFRRKNFKDVVSAELEDNDFTAVLMQSSLVELTGRPVEPGTCSTWPRRPPSTLR